MLNFQGNQMMPVSVTIAPSDKDLIKKPLKKRKSSTVITQTPFAFIFAMALLGGYSCNLHKASTTSTPINPEQRLNSTSSETSKTSSSKQLKFDYYFYNANKEKILGNYDAATKLFLSALDVNPNNAASMYELANLLQQSQNTQHALFYSKKAAAIEPDNVWYQLLYLSCLKDARKWQDVALGYQKLTKKYPDNIEFYYELSNAYLYQNKTNDAIKVYDDIETRFGTDKDITLQKIKIYQLSKNYDKAIAETEKLIALYPKEYSYYAILGEIYQNLKEPQKALETYKKMMDAAPDNPYAHLTLADYYRNQKENQKAFSEIKTAFKSTDLDIDTKVKILLSYYYITETYPELKPDADTLCKLLVEVHPEDAKSYSVYGDFLYRDKKLNEALTQYRKAIELDKEKYALWNQILSIDAELNNYESLEKESKEAMELFPTQPFPYLFNGVANMQLKKYEEAIKSFSQGKEFVVENDKLLSQFYGYLGDAHNQLKNYALSDAAYGKALSFDKNNTTVMNNYAYYLSLRNFNLPKAEALSKRSNELEPNNNSYQDTYGWVLYKMGKFSDAKIWIGKAIHNGGENNGTLLEHYGDILYQLGDVTNALKYWENAKKAGETTDLIDKKIADKKLYE
jgi:tetratricopeptide (TPR) repeat protein